MIRTIENNSKTETREIQIKELIKHFENSGYDKKQLDELKHKAMEKTESTAAVTDNNDDNQDNETLVFPLHYFEGSRNLNL